MQKGIKNEYLAQENLEVNNWLTTVVLCFFFINAVIGIPGSSYLTLTILLILCIISIKKKKFDVYPSAMIFVGVILTLFLVSFFRVRDVTYTILYFEYFGGFCIVSFLAGLQNICVAKVIAHMSPVGFVGMIVVLIRGFSAFDGPALMGLSYAILPLLLSSVIGLYLDRITRFLSIANIVMIVFCFINIAPRGIWIVVACFMAIYGFYILCKSKRVGNRLVKEVLFILVFFVIIISVLANLSDIFLGINDFLSSEYNLEIYALKKYEFYFRKGNILNERGEIWGDALNCIKENFWFGGGVGYFEILEEGEYAHNLLLQVMCEGGIFSLIPTVLVVLKSLRELVRIPQKKERNKYLFFALTFSYGVVMLFYSSVHWKFTPFWFFLGYFYKNIMISKQSIKLRMRA